MTDHTNQDNPTGQQGQTQFTGSEQDPPFNRQSDTLTTDQAQSETPTEPTTGETGFVGSDGDQSSDYLTEGEQQDFQPEGQGATDTDAGTSDIETGQPTSPDATLDDGSDTSR